MNSLRPVFYKVFTREFYRINAGFFLIVIGLCFGFLRDVEHMALAQFFIGSSFSILIPIAVWFLYALKIINFNNLAIKKPENAFVYSSALIKPLSLMATLVIVSIYQLMPAWLYGGFLSLIAYRFNQPTAVAEILSAVLFLIFLLAGKLYWDLLHPDDEKKVSLLRHKINFLVTRPFVWFYPAWITRRQPVLLIGTKVFSLLLIIGVSRLYLYESYDERLFEMGCVLAFASNLVLVYYYQRFESFHFSMLRSLPIPLSQRVGYFLLTFTILQFAEIGAMINYFPSGISYLHLMAMTAFGLSISILGYASLFYRDITLEVVIQRIFSMTLLWIVLILFKVPAGLMAGIQSALAYVLYHKHFYLFEFNAAIDSEK